MISGMSLVTREKRLLANVNAFIIAIKRYYSVLTPPVPGEAMDQLTSFCKGLRVFGSGAKVSLMSAFNISDREKREEITPIPYFKMVTSSQLFINITGASTASHSCKGLIVVHPNPERLTRFQYLLLRPHS